MLTPQFQENFKFATPYASALCGVGAWLFVPKIFFEANFDLMSAGIVGVLCVAYAVAAWFVAKEYCSYCGTTASKLQALGVFALIALGIPLLFLLLWFKLFR